MSTPYEDLAAFTALRRITGLALSTAGDRLVATVQQPDDKGSRYVTALWEIPLAGGEPVRLTASDKGETAPAFLPGGDLLFTSTRPRPVGTDDTDDDTALWLLPVRGEARVLATRAGGLAAPVVARDSGTVLLAGSRLAGSTEHDDAARRKARKDRKVSAILHAGMPIRYWDHELDDEHARLLLLQPEGTPQDLVRDARGELDEASYSISADGTRAVTTWRPRRSHGRTPFAIELIDLESGDHNTLAVDDATDFTAPTISPDGVRVAIGTETQGTFTTPVVIGFAVAATEDGELDEVDLGDLTPTEWAWSPDSHTVYVAGDFQGRGAVVAVDAETATITRRLVSDAVYASLCVGPDGSVYALRSAVDRAPVPVRLDPHATDQMPHELPTPAPTPPLPGRLEEIEAEVGGVDVHGWLCLPESGSAAPVMLWIHGGPFASWNAWSWRWNPWVAVAHGWAVVLPDPALSTGYGQSCVERAWPYLADVVWREAEGVLDAVLTRPEVDSRRVALLGASFGGFMTNWIAGHSDRFGAIVTHAGLWALDQEHATTDAAEYKTRVFGKPADHPDWYADYSPHNFADRIRTPMLISHGSRDFRVPVSEALRLWWDLASRWEGDAADFPHRFLQLTGENHWVLSPANAEVWYATVLAFCAQHVLGRPWTRPDLL